MKHGKFFSTVALLPLLASCGAAAVTPAGQAEQPVTFADEAEAVPTPISDAETALAHGDADAAYRTLATYTQGEGTNSPRAWLDLGLSEELREHPEQALAAYRHALELRPNFVMARNNLAVILREQGDLPGARRELEETLRQNPTFASAALNLALTLEDLEDYAGAKRAYERVTQLAPQEATGWIGAANCALQLGARDEALVLYQEAIPHAATLEDRYELGRGLRRTGDPTAAVGVLEQAIIESENAPPHALRGELSLARFAAGQRALAERDMEQLTRDVPDHPQYWIALGDMLAARGNYREALAKYARAGTPAAAQRADAARAQMQLGSSHSRHP